MKAKLVDASVFVGLYSCVGFDVGLIIMAVGLCLMLWPLCLIGLGISIVALVVDVLVAVITTTKCGEGLRSAISWALQTAKCSVIRIVQFAVLLPLVVLGIELVSGWEKIKTTKL